MHLQLGTTLALIFFTVIVVFLNVRTVVLRLDKMVKNVLKTHCVLLSHYNSMLADTFF